MGEGEYYMAQTLTNFDAALKIDYLPVDRKSVV